MRLLFLLFLSFGFFHQLSAQLFYKDVAGVFYAEAVPPVTTKGPTIFPL